MSRLVAVSNRCTVPRKGDAPGGLAVALSAALRESGGLWFGWNGRVTDNTPARAAVSEVDGIRYATLGLQRSDYEAFYQGYSNRVLWPLFHYRIDAVQYRPEYGLGYLRTNEFFARKLLPHLGNDDLVWVHDYHLIPLGSSLRRAGVDMPIGFFLHIPFPSYDVLRALPGHEELMWAFCAYDVIGFQTENDRLNFLDCARRVTRAKIERGGYLNWDGRRALAAAFPISIDLDNVRDMANTGRDGRTVRRLKESLQDRSFVVGADRLDYSKGLPDRFVAYQQMLRKYPQTRGHVVYLQIAQPSREDVPEYNELRVELEALVGEINGEFAEFDWVPLRYVNKGYARATIMSFLNLAKVGLVTPLRDGMNLVAKEFVAAQDPGDPGVLVLSDMTGAARELDTALLVNPLDTDAVADALQAALHMPLDERVGRWQAAFDTIRSNDVFRWSDRFVAQLEAGTPS